MNISSMLDYIRNPFASGRVSAVIGHVEPISGLNLNFPIRAFYLSGYLNFLVT